MGTRSSLFRIQAAPLALFLCLAACARSDERTEFFETKIRPALVKYCYECHSAKAKNVKGGLLLDSRSGWKAGGDSGTAIVPGVPEQSLLIEAITWKNTDLQMPPDRQLPANVIADLQRWVKSGAYDPRSGTQIRKEFDLVARKNEHWAWQPMLKTTSGSIDNFVNKRMQKAGLQAAAQADREELIRRLCFDLTGLPPTKEDLATKSIPDLVDRLIASPHFGEHWARHWLDVVRFCETKGHVTDQERPYSWKYRDYVIDAFNADLPYDRFVREQLAGDLLSSAERRPGPRGESNVAPIATNMLFMHEMHFMAVDPVRQRWDEINAQIEVVGKAFLGLTLDCARCHDHKFDAISQRDYYALAGIFYSTEQGRTRTAPRGNVTAEATKVENAYRTYLEKQRKGRRKAQAPKAGGKYFPVSEELGIQAPNHSKQVFRFMAQLESLDPTWHQWTRSAVEAKKTRDVALLIRGEPNQPGEPVARRFLEALPVTRPFGGSSSGRQWLAEQIVNPQNPLTARVWVNRLWQQLFGRGIVASPNNFGKLGVPPTHPELLDYLAQRLIKSGWSTKTIVREIVLSQAYQRSSGASEKATAEDPNNHWLSHQNRRRLTAEQIRDGMLAVSGILDPSTGGPSIDCFVPPYATANKPGNVPPSGPLDGNRRRSVYIKVRRNFYDPFLVTFDFPDRGRPKGKRDVTIVPGQALAMLNSPLVHRIARSWSESLKDVDEAFIQALGRKPTEAERKSVSELLNKPDGAYHTAHLLFNHPDFLWLR